jgi:type I restriction enzyme S subunit
MLHVQMGETITMIDDLKPYPAYKDSGVEWLGQVPEHWELKPLKRWVRINASVLPDTTPADYEFRYIDIATVGTGFLTREPQQLRFGNAPSRARRVLHIGDTIISTVRTYLRAVYYVDGDAEALVCSTGFAVLTPGPSTQPKYVSYLVESNTFTDRLTAESVGTAYPAIAEGRLGSFYVPIPPLPEQTAIVRFLDYIDRRMRRYIRAKQKLIKLLEEYKQALIHRAVTGKIDVRTGQPYPAYKPSGVEWLGEVPEHWEVIRLKYVARLRSGESITSERIEVTGDYPVYGGNGIRGFTSSFTHEGEFVLIGRQGALCGNINYANGKFWASEHAVVVHPLRKCLSHLLGELLRAMNLNQYSIAAAQPGLAVERIQNLAIPFPPIDEQEQIDQYIKNQVNAFDAAIAAARREIDLLREYRTRLIADVVTGKVDVREVAARLPEEPPEEEAESIDVEELSNGEAMKEDASDDALEEEEAEA